MKSKQTEKTFWLSHYEAWQGTKMTQEEYCKAHDLGYQDFKKWRSLLSKHGEITILNRSGNRRQQNISFSPVEIKRADAHSAGQDRLTMDSTKPALIEGNGTEIELHLPNKITLTIRCR